MILKFAEQKLAILRLAFTIQNSYRKSLLSQLTDIIRLRFGPGKLSASEYYDYCLYDDNEYDLAAKKEFGGWRINYFIPEKLNSVEWIANSQDKLFFHAAMSQLGIPSPEIQAITWGKQRFHGNTPMLKDQQTLLEFFLNDARYPMFCKPTRGNHGRQAIVVESYDIKNERFLLGNNTRLAAADLIEQLIQSKGFGYILQDKLKPHAYLQSICGDRLSGVRINVLVGSDGPEIHRTVWKIMIGDNMVDNFYAGTTGNLVGEICPQSGKILQVISGKGLSRKRVDRHPDTNHSLDGIILPDWPEVIELITKAASIFVGLKWQGWDIALTDRGPVVIEMNHINGIGILQNAYGKGIYSKRLQEMCE